MSSYYRIIRGLRGFAETSAPLAFGTRFGPRAAAARERGWFCIRGRSSVGERGITVLGRSSVPRTGESDHKDIMGLRRRHKRHKSWGAPAKPQNPQAAIKVAAQSEISVNGR